MEEIIEIWKDIAGYEGLYEVSCLGNVRNKRTGAQKSKVYSEQAQWVYLRKNRKLIRRRVSRLVAFAFVENANPELFYCVDHKDGDPKNNTARNLFWCSKKRYSEEGYINNESSKIYCD